MNKLTEKNIKKMECLCNEKVINILNDTDLVMSYSGSAFSDISWYNASRKAVCLLLYIWSKSGLIPQFEIEMNNRKHKYISFCSENKHCLYTDDPSYSNAVNAMLNETGWSMDDRWNYSPYYESSRKLSQLDAELLDFVENNADIFSDCEFTVLDCENYDIVTYQNSKLDIVHTIFKNKKDNPDIIKEYQVICDLADKMLSPFYFSPICMEKIECNGNTHYMSIYEELFDEYGNLYSCDIQRFYQPDIFHTVAKLNLKMDQFIAKYLFS